MYRSLAEEEPNRRIRFRQWLQVVQLLRKNPILDERLNLSEVDRLFYSHTHSGGLVSRHITLKQFKTLLDEISESMRVPSAMVQLAIAGHAAQLSAPEAPALQKRSNSVTQLGCRGAARTSLPPLPSSRTKPIRRQTVE